MLKLPRGWLLLVMLLAAGCAPAPARDFVPPPAPAVQVVNPSAEEQVVTLVAESTPAPATVTPAALPQPTSSPTGLPVVQEFPALADLGIETATYTDPHAGFSFDYPANWVLTSALDDSYTNSIIYSMSVMTGTGPSGPKQQEGISPGQSKVEIVVFQDKTWTLEEAVAERKRANAEAELGPVTILSEEQWLLPGGLEGLRWQQDSRGDKTNLLITTIDGRMVLVAGMGDAALYEAIAGTLRENP